MEIPFHAGEFRKKSCNFPGPGSGPHRRSRELDLERGYQSSDLCT